MNLKEIAKMVLVQDNLDFSSPEGKEVSETASPVAVTTNPDGTVTYSVIVEFDPKVQAEKSKAMPKGVKRDDLADDLSETEEVDEESEEGEGETAEDSAPRGVFAAALDEIISGLLPGFAPAEDAAPSRHSKTPLENCRAKDPMYCPYHGDKAIKKAIEDNLAKTGVSAYTVTVTPSGKGKYTISVNTPTPTPAAATAILGAFSDSQGNMKSGINLAIGQNTTTQNVGVQVDSAEDRDTAMLDEWIDDLVQDIAADTSLMQELDPQDMRDLLDAREKLDGLHPPAKRDPLNPSPYEQALKESRDKYHSLRAQVDFRDVKTLADAQKKQSDISKEVAKMDADYHADKSPVDNAKKALFKNGRFPNGFAKMHQWVEAYNKASTGVGYFAQKRVDDAVAAYGNAGNDLKSLRIALSEIDYAKESYANALDGYRKAVPEFMKEFENWAMNDPSISPAQFKAAFPNSSAKQGATANSPANAANNSVSSGKVNLPQSWNNFVMGDNLVMPTDGLPDLPYGKEKGFHDAFDSAFPKLPVPDVMESFEIKPHSGEVIYSLSPGATALNANAPKNFVNALWGAGYAGAKLQPIPHKAGFEVVIPFNANLAGK